MRRSNGCHPAYAGRVGPVGSEDWRASRSMEVRALLESLRNSSATPTGRNAPNDDRQ